MNIFDVTIVLRGDHMEFDFQKFIDFELRRKNMKAIEFANSIGVTSAYVSKMRKEKVTPSAGMLKRMAEKLGIDYNFLLYQFDILDESTLLHINAFATLKSYLSEIMNINHMGSEQIEILLNFMKEKESQLEEVFNEKHFEEIKLMLGKNFDLPRYKNPYGKDSYAGYKKMDILYLADKSTTSSKGSVLKYPVTSFFNVDMDLSYFGFDYSIDAKNLDKETEKFWYKPIEKFKLLYLVETNTDKDYKDKDMILFKNRNEVFIGTYNDASEIYPNDIFVITDVFKYERSGYGEKIMNQSPIIFYKSNVPEGIQLIGKIILIIEFITSEI